MKLTDDTIFYLLLAAVLIGAVVYIQMETADFTYPTPEQRRANMLEFLDKRYVLRTDLGLIPLTEEFQNEQKP